MSIPQIIKLLEFCLKNTYFLFQGKYYEKIHGSAMGSPISPVTANLFMEDFEVKTLSSSPQSPHLWLRHMDDSFVIQLHKEMEDIRKALQACNFPSLALNTLQQNSTANTTPTMDKQPLTINPTTRMDQTAKNISIVVPYIHRLGESLKRTGNNLRIQVHFKGSNAIKPSSRPLWTGTTNFKKVESYTDLNVYT